MLRVVGKDGSDRECYRRKASYAALLHTTADESQVLVLFDFRGGAELALIRLSDGSQQILLSDGTLVGGRTPVAALSDDGGLLAFRRRIVSSPTEKRIGLFVRILTTQIDIPVDTISSDSSCSIAGWTRGRTLLYSCDRGQGSEIRRWQFDQSTYTAPVAGSPHIIDREIEKIRGRLYNEVISLRRLAEQKELVRLLDVLDDLRDRQKNPNGYRSREGMRPKTPTGHSGSA